MSETRTVLVNALHRSAPNTAEGNADASLQYIASLLVDAVDGSARLNAKRKDAEIERLRKSELHTVALVHATLAEIGDVAANALGHDPSAGGINIETRFGNVNCAPSPWIRASQNTRAMAEEIKRLRQQIADIETDEEDRRLEREASDREGCD